MRRSCRALAVGHFELAWILALLLLFVSTEALANSGQLLVRLKDDLPRAGGPTLTLRGPGCDRSVVIGIDDSVGREIRFEDLEPGIYRLAMEGIGAAAGIEAGVYEGVTTAVNADLDRGILAVEPDHPDPFGPEDGWDPSWLDVLPGSGDEGPGFAATAPVIQNRVEMDGLDLSGTGFRQSVQVRGRSMARSVRSPIGVPPAWDETTTRRLLHQFDPGHAEIEMSTGARGRGAEEGTVERGFEKFFWKPHILASVRGLDYLDAAPSVFENKRLPHNGLEELELLTRLDLHPSAASRLTALVYGEGSRRRYFVESYRFDATHAPRQDAAAFQGMLRAAVAVDPRTRVAASLGVQRSYIATGDGRFFDDITGYQRIVNPGSDANELYWLGDNPETKGDEGHAFNYFRRNVQVDLTARLEGWRSPGTSRAAGAGVLLRRGTYRSYEHTNPTNASAWASAIGYDPLGESHDEAGGSGPGHPLTAAGWASIRRPMFGGEIETGLRLTLYKTGQQPLRDLSNPLGADGRLDEQDLAAKPGRAALDPRVGYTHLFGMGTRVWAQGGIETRLPPSEAVYYDRDYLERTAFATDPKRPANAIFGNPDLKPERAWTGLLAASRRITPPISLTAGIQGRRIADAFVARLIPVQSDSLAFYVNDGRRDLLDILARLVWEPSPAFRARAAYDLSWSRTESVEPTLLERASFDDDLPQRGADTREGLPLLLPLLEDGASAGAYPSVLDQQHRFSLAVSSNTPPGLIGEAARFLFKDMQVGAVLRVASGGRFTWYQVYSAGRLGGRQIPNMATGRERNVGRLPWTDQLDVRATRLFNLFGSEIRIWAQATNLLNRHNVVHVYPSTGKGNDDGWLAYSEEGRQAAREGGDDFVDLYRSRIRDPLNYGEPRLLAAGVRVSFR